MFAENQSATSRFSSRSRLVLTGRIVRYDPRRASGIQVHEAAERSFASGERIQFTSPWNEQRIAKRETGTILKADGDGIAAVQPGRSGWQFTWKLSDMPHRNYAYAMTSHSAQGLTVARVLIQIDATDSRTRALAERALPMLRFRVPGAKRKFDRR